MFSDAVILTALDKEDADAKIHEVTRLLDASKKVFSPAQTYMPLDNFLLVVYFGFLAL